VAKKFWTGAGNSQPKIVRITIGSATAAQTFTVTGGNSASETYTAGSGETTETVRDALLELLQNSDEGEFAELTFEEDTAATDILVTGPADGAPFTLAVAGTGTISLAAVQSELSPHDYNRAANWSGSALPAVNDEIVFDTGDVDVKYNLAALTNAMTSWTRLPTYTGRIGLPDYDEANGYRQYRGTHLEINSTTIRVEGEAGDQPGQFRLRGTNVAATTVTVAGPSGGVGGGEVIAGQWNVELYGLPASSVLNLVNASVALAPYTGQTGTAATLRALNSTLYAGAGATLTTVNIQGGAANLDAGFTTLTIDDGAQVSVGQAAAAATGLTIEAGTVFWKSSGGTGTILIGSQGTFDASQAPAAFTVGTITRRGGSTLVDSAERITRPYTVAYPDADLAECPTDLGTGFTLTVNN
jgi:hypothetical protein